MTCIINDKIYIYTNLYSSIKNVCSRTHTHTHAYKNITFRKGEIPILCCKITDLVTGHQNLTHVSYDRFLCIKGRVSENNTGTRIPLIGR